MVFFVLALILMYCVCIGISKVTMKVIKDFYMNRTHSLVFDHELLNFCGFAGLDSIPYIIFQISLRL